MTRNELIVRAQSAQQRLMSYLNSEEFRWRALLVTGRYTSHIAIIAVIVLAIVLAGTQIVRLRAPAAPERSPAVAERAGAANAAAQRDAGPEAYSPVRLQSYGAVVNQDAGLVSRRAVFTTPKVATARTATLTYTVQAGDTLEAIAARFNLLPTTLMWSNKDVEEKPDLLEIGQVLSILPVNGVLHTVAANDTLDDIAKRYKVKPGDIVGLPQNGLDGQSNLLVGQRIIVPDGVKPLVLQQVGQAGAAPARGRFTGTAPNVAATGSFRWPTQGVITQNYWWGHRGIDIANSIGTPVVASDAGYVQFAGWSPDGYGNLIIVNHGNGFSSYYAHLSTIFAVPGQQLARGQAIGAVGSTGRSTGPHLHFEIRQSGGQLNPFFYLP